MSPSLIIVAFLSALANTWWWTGINKLRGDDFASLWVAGLLTRNGESGAIYARDPKDFALVTGPEWEQAVRNAGEVLPIPHPYVHIPLVAEFFGFLSRFQSFHTTLVILTGISGFCAVALICSAYHLWFKETISLPLAVLASALLLASTPFQQAAFLGQTSPLIFTLIAWGLAASTTTRPPLHIMGGIALACSALIKITPFALIALLLLFPKTRRSGLVASAVSVAGLLLSFLLEMRATTTWFSVLRETSSAAIITGANQSPLSWLLHSKYHPSPDLLAPIYPDYPTSASLILFGSALLSGVLLCCGAFLNRARSVEILAVGGLMTMMLVQNIMWLHYALVLPLVIWGILYLAAECPQVIHSFLLIATTLTAISFFPPFTGPDFVVPERVIVPWAGLVSMVSALVLFLLASTSSAVGHQINRVRTRPRS